MHEYRKQIVELDENHEIKRYRKIEMIGYLLFFQYRNTTWKCMIYSYIPNEKSCVHYISEIYQWRMRKGKFLCFLWFTNLWKQGNISGVSIIDFSILFLYIYTLSSRKYNYSL